MSAILRLLAVLFAVGEPIFAIEISTDFPGGNVIVLENEGASVRLKPDPP